MPKYLNDDGVSVLKDTFVDNIPDGSIGTDLLADGSITPDKLADAVRKGYVRAFDTVADMQATTDLKAGMTCHTNGFHAAGDGGSAFYKVAANGDIALQGGLYATEVNASKVYKVVTVASEERSMCTALIDGNGSTIMFDLSDETNGVKVVSDLIDAGVQNVVAVVISHYHHDHLGDYETIFGSNGLSHDGVQFFIPDAPIESYTSAAFVASYNSFIAWLSTNNINYRTPTENESVIVDGVSMTFNNTDLSYWYSNYTPETFNYNWTSMCTFVEFASCSMQCMGDLYTKGLDYFQDVLKATRKANILNSSHHGLSYYVNREFVESCAPAIVLGNYGTNNSYVPQRPYSSGMVDYCNSVGVPFFDTADNGTFTILAFNGALDYNGLTPSVFAGEIITFPSIGDLNRFTDAKLTSASSLIEVLEAMPINSKVTFLCYDTYQIATALGIPNRTMVDIVKYVGGATNYLLNRKTDGDFAFSINCQTMYPTENEYIVITGRRASGVYTVGVNQYVPKAYANLHISKAAASDTQYKFSVTANKTFAVGINADATNKTFSVDRAGVYKVTLQPNASSTTPIAIQINGEKLWAVNGAGCTRIVRLASGTNYTVDTTDSNTNSAELFIELVGTATSVTFPSA